MGHGQVHGCFLLLYGQPCFKMIEERDEIITLVKQGRHRVKQLAFLGMSWGKPLLRAVFKYGRHDLIYRKLKRIPTQPAQRPAELERIPTPLAQRPAEPERPAELERIPIPLAQRPAESERPAEPEKMPPA
ncbi:hypothetical protein TNCV_373051 [Trichonephila clavipes]|nr:hypothetical protein TNCV_373051 [Trichonephila clavipes]